MEGGPAAKGGGRRAGLRPRHRHQSDERDSAPEPTDAESHTGLKQYIRQERQVSGRPSKQSPANSSHVEGQHSKAQTAELRAGIRKAPANSTIASTRRGIALPMLFIGPPQSGENAAHIQLHRDGEKK
jgi:hypothetical protein